MKDKTYEALIPLCIIYRKKSIICASVIYFLMALISLFTENLFLDYFFIVISILFVALNLTIINHDIVTKEKTIKQIVWGKILNY